MNKLSTVLLIAIIAVATFTVAYAVTSWTKTFTWQKEVVSFSVYEDEALSIIWDPGIEPLGTIADPTTKTFYIENDGNVPITVSVTGESISGATVTWDAKTTPEIPVGYYIDMTLTLESFTITDCSYTFTFTATEVP